MTSFPGLPAPLAPTGSQAPSPWSPFHRWEDGGLAPSGTSWAATSKEWGTQQVLRSRWGGPRVSTDGEAETQVSGRTAQPGPEPPAHSHPASAPSPASAAGQSLSPDTAPHFPAGRPGAGTQAVGLQDSREGHRLPWGCLAAAATFQTGLEVTAQQARVGPSQLDRMA